MIKKLIFIVLIIFTITSNLAFYILESNAKMAEYKKAEFTSAEVTADILNVRTGPGLDYPVICKVFMGDIIRVFAKIGEWYLIQNDNNYFGLVKGEFIKKYSGNAVSNSTLTKEEKQLFDLVNNERKKNGLQPLRVDSNLTKIARLKAKDMVNENYFSHTSSKYGSPFKMMENHGIKYKTAAENIAGSADAKQTLQAWMKTDSHKKNLLNKNFNYTGIGIAESKEYGKIIVEEFVGR